MNIKHQHDRRKRHWTEHQLISIKIKPSKLDIHISIVVKMLFFPFTVISRKVCRQFDAKLIHRIYWMKLIRNIIVFVFRKPIFYFSELQICYVKWATYGFCLYLEAYCIQLNWINKFCTKEWRFCILIVNENVLVCLRRSLSSFDSRSDRVLGGLGTFPWSKTYRFSD